MKFGNGKLAVILVGLASISVNVNAKTPSYNYVSVDYLRSEVKDFPLDFQTYTTPDKDISFDGGQLAVSIEFANDWFGELRHQAIKGDANHSFITPLSNISPSAIPPGATTNEDVLSYDITGNLTTFSLGYQVYRSEVSSAFLAAGYSWTEVEVDLFHENIYRDSDGQQVPNIPGYFASNSTTESVNDSGVLLSAGYRHSLNDMFQLGVRVDHYRGDDPASELSAQALCFVTEQIGLQLGATVSDDSLQYSAGARYEF